MDKTKLDSLAETAEGIENCFSEIAALSNHFWGIGFSTGAKDLVSKNEAAAAEAAFSIIERVALKMKVIAADLAVDIKALEKEGGADE